MSKRGKIMILGGSILLLLLAGAGLAIGEAYQNSPFKKGPAYFLEKMDAGAYELNLTPAQREKFEGLKAGIKESMEKGRREGREMFGRIKDELGKDEPDMNLVASLMKTQMTDIQTRIGAGIDRFAEFYGALDGKQKELVLAKAREHMDRPHCQGHGGPWNQKKE